MARNRSLRHAGRWSLAIWMVMAMMFASFTPAAPARAGVDGTVGAEGAADDPPADGDRWWGALGAAGCGGEFLLIRTVPAVGMNPYVLAGGIACCALAALDVFTTK